MQQRVRKSASALNEQGTPFSNRISDLRDAYPRDGRDATKFDSPSAIRKR